MLLRTRVPVSSLRSVSRCSAFHVSVSLSLSRSLSRSVPFTASSAAQRFISTSVSPHFASSSSGPSVNSDGTIDFNLADIGEGIAECELIRWFVKPGDVIQQFDKVCEVQSDKATTDITSRYDGVVKELKYQPGQLAKVGKPLLTLAVQGGQTQNDRAPQTPEEQPKAQAQAQSQPRTGLAPSSSSDSDRILTSPAVRRIAKEERVDLSQVQGTGPAGRILKEDVVKFIANGGQTQANKAVKASSAAPAQPSAASPASVSVSASASSPSPAPLGADQVVPVSGLARIMVQTMTAANAVPQLGFCEEISVDSLVALRDQLKPQAEKAGVKLSYLPFLIKATSLALRQFPSLNAHTNSDCSAVTYRAAHNIGIAMDTPRGLLVPNIKNVESKSILEIATELGRLQALGSAGRLGKEELSGGTFTLSNIGTLGGTYLKPILVVPEVVIGGIGSIATVPKFVSKNSLEIRAAKILYMSWSADHRVVDGATMARFSNAWKSFVENPNTILLHTK